jgi:hypothetical protein
MRHLSVKISEELLQQLIEKGRQMGVDNVSDSVRILLIWALENREEDVQRGKNKVLLHQATNHSIITHCLIEGLLTSMEGGENLRDIAYAKAEKMMASVLEE